MVFFDLYKFMLVCFGKNLRNNINQSVFQQLEVFQIIFCAIIAIVDLSHCILFGLVDEIGAGDQKATVGACGYLENIVMETLG
ncbi:hypothetical protein ASG93_22530 [Paenibacillus sp. Soil787]|nr:hypothetical protein ASG93_22530 [Paenibacillus sp. Soil787]